MSPTAAAMARRLLARAAELNTATCERCGTGFAPKNGGAWCPPCDFLTSARRMRQALSGGKTK